MCMPCKRTAILCHIAHIIVHIYCNANYLHKRKKPPLCKGRWVLRSKTRRDCLIYTFILQILQINSITIPHPRRGSPLCTRGPFFFVCYAKPSLHGGSFIFVLARHAPGVRETNFRIREPLAPFLGESLYLFTAHL